MTQVTEDTTRTRIAKLEASQAGLKSSVDTLHRTMRENGTMQRTFYERFYKEVHALRGELRDELLNVHQGTELYPNEAVGRELRIRDHSQQLESIQLQIDKRAERRRHLFDMVLGALISLAVLFAGYTLTEWKPWT